MKLVKLNVHQIVTHTGIPECDVEAPDHVECGYRLEGDVWIAPFSPSNDSPATTITPTDLNLSNP